MKESDKKKEGDNPNATGALDPVQIYREIHKELERLLSFGLSEEFMAAHRRMIEEFPIIAYIYHMELSMHSKGFRELIKDLIGQGTEIRTPLADAGCGPGHMMWWYIKDGLIPPGKIAMVDMDPASIDYARELLVNRPEAKASADRRHKFRFLSINLTEMAKKAAKRSKFNTVLSSLVLQWVGQDLPPDEAEKIRREACKAIYDSLNPGGNFIFIGEEPPNVTATTPLALLQSGGKNLNADLGYSNGVSMAEIEQICLEIGFQPEKEALYLMGMINDISELIKVRKRYKALNKKMDSGKVLSKKEDMQYLNDYLITRNAHLAKAQVYRKPG